MGKQYSFSLIHTIRNKQISKTQFLKEFCTFDLFCFTTASTLDVVFTAVVVSVSTTLPVT